MIKVPKTFSWTTKEYTYYEKTPGWYIAALIIAVIFAVWAVFSKNFLFVVFLILASFAVYIYSMKKPTKLQIKIDRAAIRINNRSYPFEELISFWIHYQPDGEKLLTFRTKKLLESKIELPLEDQNPVAIRKRLIKLVPEKEETITIIDKISDILGF